MLRALTAIIALGLILSPATALARQLPRLEALTRIGCVECEGPTSFASIQTLAVYGGRIYVAERDSPLIRVFGTDGRLVRAFARKGRGPGEQQLPIHLGPRALGELEVYDMTLRRITRYDSTGAPIATRTTQGFTALAAGVPGGADLHLLQTDFRTTDQPIVRMADGSEEAVRMVTLNHEFPKLQPGEHARTPSMAANPRGGVAVGDGIAEYRIRRFDADGRVLGDIVRDIPKLRKTPAEIAAEQARAEVRRGAMAARMRAEGGSGAMPAFTPRPEHNHFDIDALAYDDAGRLWVRTPRGGLEQTIFDLFDGAGAHLGEVRVAKRVGTYAVHGGLMAGVVTDDDEVQFVQVWRVR